MTRRLLTVTALLTVVFGAAQATAQTYPNRPIRVVVPSTPGSPTDVMARLVAQSLTTTIGQNVFVEPRPGGGGIIGTKTVIAAEPDGYTLLFTEGAKHLMTPALYDSVGFDPVGDITPVATAGGGSFAIVNSLTTISRNAENVAKMPCRPWAEPNPAAALKFPRSMMPAWTT